MLKVLAKRAAYGVGCLTLVGVLVALEVPRERSSFATNSGPIEQPTEIWITPAVSHADEEDGNWAVTEGSSTHFSFSVPGNMTSFSAAQVVLIGDLTGMAVDPEGAMVTYNLNLSVSSAGNPQDDLPISMMGLGPVALAQDELLEIDVTAIFDAAGPFVLGDVVSLKFEINSSPPPPFVMDAQVVGLRFQFEGPVGPQGEPGEPGEPGPPGISGYEIRSDGQGNLVVGFGQEVTFIARCSPGKKALGGGGIALLAPPARQIPTGNLPMVISAPVGTPPMGGE